MFNIFLTINKLPSKFINKIYPFELLNEKPPDLMHLKLG